jgi:predicted ATPase/class 3 adenylate cyclase
MGEQPSGTVTLLFSDIEGSTRLLQELGRERYREALDLHRRLLREAFARHHGYEVDYEGDAFFVAFQEAAQAVAAAGDAQRALAQADWPDGKPIRVRVGLHTGEPGLDPPKYLGLDVHKAARIMSAGHGGQVLLSRETRQLIDERFLLRDLGEHRLKDFAEPVLLFQLGEADFPPLKTISNTNLPRPASSFVGRAGEVGEVVELLRREDVRMLTLTGPGGSGKTRLAVEAAAELVGEFPAGVFWVGLSSLRDPALVLETVGQALGARDGPASHIEERQMLLLLDNLEQVAEAAPELARLAAACPNLHLLCTSRELLRVSGELEYPVLPLAEPEAVELFCARAQVEAEGVIGEICRRLDNLPLAVELAAARVRVLSPERILEHLEQRLPLLTSGARDLPERQRTLRGTIAWSHELLTPEEQRLFRCLATFAGGCTLEAAEQVAGADLDTLQSLVEKSLLRHAGDRYWMLETIREFAGERLELEGELGRQRRRHAEHFVAMAAEIGKLESIERGLARFASDRDNLRAAFEFVMQEEDADTALEFIEHLWTYWFFYGPLQEGEQCIRRALDLASEANTRLYVEGITILGEFLRFSGRNEEAVPIKERALALYESLGDTGNTAATLHDLADIWFRLGDYDRARALSGDALRIRHDRGRPAGVAHALSTLVDVELAEGNYEEALRISLEILDLLGADEQNVDLRANALLGAAAASRRRGDYREAREFARDALALVESVSLRFIAPEVLVAAAELSVESDARSAAVLLAAGRAIRTEIGFAAWDSGEEGRTEAAAVARLGEAAASEATLEGESLALEEALGLARDCLA